MTTTIETLLARIADGEAKIASEKAKGLADDHPRIVKARVLMQELHARLDEAAGIVRPDKPVKAPDVDEAPREGPIKKRGVPRSKARSTDAWCRAPARIMRSKSLSARAKSAASAIASATNGGEWNTDLRCDLSYKTLAKLIGVSPRTAKRAVKDLADGGYFPTKPQDRNRAGIRYHLFVPCTNPRCLAHE